MLVNAVQLLLYGKKKTTTTTDGQRKTDRQTCSQEIAHTASTYNKITLNIDDLFKQDPDANFIALWYFMNEMHCLQ